MHYNVIVVPRKKIWYSLYPFLILLFIFLRKEINISFFFFRYNNFITYIKKSANCIIIINIRAVLILYDFIYTNKTSWIIY